MIITLANGKGGVGKTTISTNLGGVMGAACSDSDGSRVLLIDLDPQGNSDVDLGIENTDKGKSLLDAVKWWGTPEAKPPTPQPTGRPNYDFLSAGPTYTTILDEYMKPVEYGGVGSAAFRGVLAELSQQYSVVLIDAPPANPGSNLVQAALDASDKLLIPVKNDKRSIQIGIQLMLDMLRRAQTNNGSKCKLLGTVIFDSSPQSTGIRKQMAEQIKIMGRTSDGDHNIHVFESYIPHSERSAFDSSYEGKLAYEYQKEATAYLKEWVTHMTSDSGGAREYSPSGASDKIASSYAGLVKEIILKLTEGATTNVS